MFDNMGDCRPHGGSTENTSVDIPISDERFWHGPGTNLFAVKDIDKATDRCAIKETNSDCKQYKAALIKNEENNNDPSIGKTHANARKSCVGTKYHSKDTFCNLLLKQSNTQDPNIQTIKDDIKEMMDGVIKGLATTDIQIFKGCTIIHRGSMHDGTKVGKPDEFDCMIILHALKDWLEELHLTSFPAKVTWRDIEDENGVVETIPNKDKILEALQAAMKSSLLKEWSLPDVNSIYHELHDSCAIAFLLERSMPNGPPLEVSLDITFAFPLPEFVTKNYSKFSVSGDDVCYGVLEKDFQQIKLDRPMGEKNTMLKYSNSDCGQNQCLRMAKFIALSWYGTFEKQMESYSLVKAQLPSYVVKTILHYMCQDYPTDTDWNGSELWQRLMELFERLEDASCNKELENFFVKDHNVVEFSSRFDSDYIHERTQNLLEQLRELDNGILDGDNELIRTVTYYTPVNHYNMTEEDFVNDLSVNLR